MAADNVKQSNGWDNDDKFIWGMFYYNPEDKRLMPPKRIKWLGWTVNFANPASIVLNAVIVALVIIIGSFFHGRYIHF